MASIADFPDEPRYNIKSVSRKTEINSVTIRAWERRYGLLEPKRAPNGYRLYSERDVAVLLWAKSRTESGMSISSAVEEFRGMKKSGKWPEATITAKAPGVSKQGGKLAPDTAVRQLFQALVRHDERTASMVFEDILGNSSLLQLFEDVLTPVLVLIGDGWARGEINVATEHFASNFILSRLQSIFNSLPLHSTAVQVMIGCAPDELHVIGPLMLAILLRDTGYRVEFLGPDVPLDDLAEYISEEPPNLLILSATIRESGEMLIGFSKVLQEGKAPPVFGFGGAAFNSTPGLLEKTDGHYLGPSLSRSLEAIQQLIPLRSHRK